LDELTKAKQRQAGKPGEDWRQVGWIGVSFQKPSQNETKPGQTILSYQTDETPGKFRLKFFFAGPA
jgi:hypothetical protein